MKTDNESEQEKSNRSKTGIDLVSIGLLFSIVPIVYGVRMLFKALGND